MSYSYQGIPINTITYITGGTANTPYGSNFITTPVPSGQNLSLPLNLSYQINGTDISNNCTAAYSDVNTNSGGVDISAVAPNAKSFRYVIVGGGGGGGGYGGNASAKNNTSDNTAKGNGGDGGDGGYGTYSYGTVSIVSGQNTISVSIGNGGGGGNANANNGNNSTSGSGADIPGKSATGDKGEDGGNGGPTTIVYSSFTTNTAGGTYGEGGGGANAYLSATNGLVNSYKGSNGDDGTLTTSNYNPICPLLGNAGNPGIGGYGQENSSPEYATAGTSGACRIIWLYN